MGMLVDGVWTDRWYDTAASGGRFVRSTSVFRRWTTRGNAVAPDGRPGVPAERGRYLLIVSHACPWAHRTLILRALKGLEDHIPLAVVHWRMLEEGWTFEPGPGVVPPPIPGVTRLHEVYTRADPTYTGRVTVPVLYDLSDGTIVNNESSEIIRMLNGAFDDLGALPGDYSPEHLRAEIDAVNARVYDSVNNGVYKAGFATTQAAYEEAVRPLFETLDWLEARLSTRRWLVGDRFTEADVRLFTTLIRFDAVYVGHFKCNLRRIADYPALSGYVREIYQHPAIRPIVHFDHIKGHYYESHRTINPTAIVPLGPVLDLDAPHGRDGLPGLRL
ncbi:glutathione S-transferase family protein [Oharaeibacter diazotrophicus]|uniref:Putative glutathione S-transferase n=1 Tax=Oharaeibacter diazotrophicus TaxID=1920512 RepID=A0A4R6R9J7_9HYPH|nr:glutathione S-transferase family protein [Oharaeibacter diazotrophicus]TDP82740.1 putative glutathione S-transferase [Oharaeibacter diazotrophicus]BBE72498.1 glutathionyl-hydroquinone reductase YqjG [Pleomorphomonas sp. SM30]GLS76529.1 glutathione-dependent reductase [Oharaeibacter diazotrophicus]